jgi:arginyl-tRNA synthetase
MADTARGTNGCDDMNELLDFAGLARSLAATLADLLGQAGLRPVVELTVPSRPEHGDVTTNAALVYAGGAGVGPREFAAEFAKRWLAQGGDAVCARHDVAGPGFINLFLNARWYQGALRRMLDAGADYGRDVIPAGERRRMNIEFVSVNPTGPLHVGHARYASYGDALCRIFAFAGHEVTREFYVNDYGTQIAKFGQSLAARYGQRLGLDTPVPDEGYQGEYLADLAGDLVAEVGELYREALAVAAPDVTRLDPEVVEQIKWWGRDRILADFRGTLERLRVPFDVWKSETSLYDGGDLDWRGFRGEVGKALTQMDAEGHLYEADGAVWLRTTEYGDDKDRVLVRQTGLPTYFLSDIAYHRDKMDRGFEHLINIWGADHHGYVPRMKAMFAALPPHDPDRLELIIGQMVNLMESGAAKRMSKRKGDIVTVADLMDAIGVDAVRFYMVGRSQDSTLDLDLALAVEQSSKNPVYYVQYAHARICSILRNLQGGEPSGRLVQIPAIDVGPYESSLVRTLARFPLVIAEAAARRAPHRLHGYLGEVAAEFHVFYRHCRVLTKDPAEAAFRTALCVATRNVLAAGLGLLGVSAPERM